ncbi:protein phosphatase 1 regulatory subunit 12B-like [Brienomyrus brachyistius]|uniref:protein phosphatase 1 regulatory subunit 12B-like n=1 Tax=Brienomyrus brachyistius TaxID=42636 RepID=UPI0020B2152F|nr:protein phosphatase 1 regulatory subunit 12B-like [Brienomyrus brachyistius]XP_048878250.1 protein phosphatase 1 regulatory subunit 12B-like [Brienomyrus brachyistius]
MSSLYTRSKDLSYTRRSPSDLPLSSCSLTTRSLRQERTSRVAAGLGSTSQDGATDRGLVRSASYTIPRETPVVNLSRVQDKADLQNYKKMYEGALAENKKLKSRMEVNKQELTKIQTQLDKITQKHDRISEMVLETEKKEKRVLEKQVSEMEEKFKVLTNLKSENQKLKDENGALIRVISKLSK